ncbi:MAG: four helix bundle protein [Candidatus Omnitrophica bacterium]|nr:four helix bundle protein [Candidatus Omnitrophota bacterium]
MARYQHLPIYKLTYELLGRVMLVTKDFPRDHKYTLGQKLRDEIISCIVLIYRANSSEEKVKIINEILEKILVMELLIRLSHDMHILSIKHYAGLVEMTESLSRQAEGWKKSASKA